MKQSMPRVTGKQIARHAGLHFEHVLYRRTGDWYHVLDRFPAALLDQTGYIPFQVEADYRLFVTKSLNGQVIESRNTNSLTIRGGISQHPEYIILPERFVSPEQIAQTELFEGATTRITVNRYERSVRARKLCLAKWGVACMVCDLRLGSVYGQVGEGFIHVHHLTPISSINEEYTLVPERDLRPVCPNCHAMLHRKEPPYSINELRAILGLPR